MNLTKTKFGSLLLLATLSFNAVSHAQYIQTNTGIFASQNAAPNPIEKSATTAPNDLSTFTSAVLAAFNTNFGGVFDFPAVPTGHTVFRGMYGTNYSKQLEFITSATMTIVQASSTLTPVSSPYACTSSTDIPGYNIAIGRPTAVATGLALPNEVVVQIGFAILARNAANGYPLDVQATVSFSDGSTQAVTANILAPKASDDTFYGFTAPNGLYITNLNLQSFSTGTTTPKATRIGFDDFGFITKESAPPPPPVIYDVTPPNYAIIDAAEGVNFQAQSFVNIDPTNVFLRLNASDVSSQLVVTGSSTNRQVSYSGLLAGQEYSMIITVTNGAGSTSVTQTLYTATNAVTLFNSEGFTADPPYPIGPLQAVTHGRGTWAPHASEPAEIVDAGGGQGKVLQRLGTGATRADFLSFPPVSSGTLIIEFDAFASTISGRTMDVAIQPISGGTMGSFLAWGEVPGKLAYFDNVNWLPIADLPTDFHHVKIINYLSGPAGGYFDLILNGVTVAEKLRWRNAAVGSAFNQMRIQTANTVPLFEYGQIDNLVITAGPTDLNAFLPPSILNVKPIGFGIQKPAEGVHFEVLSGVAVNAANITLLLNSIDVSSQLVVTGNATNKFVSFTNLQANTTYAMQIAVSNSTGLSIFTNRFYAYTNELVLYDSGGFTDDSLYPLGPLGMVMDGEALWTPAANPSEIRDSGEAPFGKVLRRAQVGTDQIENLSFAPISSGVIRYSFDARMSDPSTRTVDFTLMNGAGTMTSFVMLGTNALNYILPGGAFTPGPAVDGAWHHYEVVNHLSGNLAGTYDLYFDGTRVGAGGFGWRSAVSPELTPLSRFRVGGIRGALDAYGDVDNLRLTASPGGVVALPVSLLAPTRTATAFSFSFVSQTGISHVVQYKQDLGVAGWTTLETISGDGSTKTVTHLNPPGQTLFYRVNSQ